MADLAHPTPHRFAAALAEARQRYVRANPESAAQHARAAEVLPGGNTRTVLHTRPFPITLASGEGATVTSIDGRRYVDFLGEYTAGLYGHSHPALRRAVLQALDGGWVLGGHVRGEEELARLIRDRFASIELLRFANSGTEANLYAIAAARAVSGRPKVVVFEGGYHGGVLSFGGGVGPLTAPFDFVLAPYNDVAGARALLDADAASIGTVVVEPMQGAGGCIVADVDFLRFLREWSSAQGALLVFDEVVTSRLAWGGLQSACGIRPDLTTLGKYLGGGFAFGAFGGRADVMRRFDPAADGAFGHAGTFNNNVFTMAAGAAGLREVLSEAALRDLNDRGERLRRRLEAIAERARFPLQVIGRGSTMNVHAHRGPVRSVRDLAGSDATIQELFWLDMLEAGFWVARRGMVNLSLPIGDAETARFADAFAAFVARHDAGNS